MNKQNTTNKMDIYYIEVSEFIEAIVIDNEMRFFLREYLQKEFIEDKTAYFDVKRLDHRVSWILLVVVFSRVRIQEINWSFLCRAYNLELFDEVGKYNKYYSKLKIGNDIEVASRTKTTKVGWIQFYKLINNIYIYLYKKSTFCNYINIKEITEYNELLIEVYSTESLKIKENNTYDYTYKNILSNFPIDSKYGHIIQTEYISSTGREVKVNYNINTHKIFIKELLLDFLLTFNKSKEVSSKIIKIFLYYFIKSIANNIIPASVEEFSIEMFKEQYFFYEKIGEGLEEKQTLPRGRFLKETLVSFYRYLINNTYKKQKIELFTPQFRQALFCKSFYGLFESGYEFVYHNQLEQPPKVNKFSLLPSIQSLNNANTYNYTLINVDLEIINEKYREDVRNFIWYSDGNTRSLLSYLHKIAEFLNMKDIHNELNKNIINMTQKNMKDFSEDFLWEYRSEIETQSNDAQLRNILKAIRKFLKYHEIKYKVNKTDFDILSLRGLGEFKGGKPISKKDCALIYEQFEKFESESKFGRLHMIIFEIFLCSNLRIGEILNLKRENVSIKNSTLKYISKTEKVMVKQKVSQQIINLIQEAITITKEYIKENDLMSEYIFIKPRETRNVDKNRRLNFYETFKFILKEIGDDLDDKYSPNNIRHTFIDSAFSEGIKHGLSLVRLAAVTRNSYKTCNRYYRKRDNVDLYVETLSKVIINDVDINGNVLKIESNNHQKIVRENLGVCNSESCIFDLAECLICTHFVTFINRIPAFEQMILHINGEIESSSNAMIIRELNVVKKLLGKYLSEMIKMSMKESEEKDEK